MDNSKELGSEKIGKLLWKFSIPAIVGMVVNALYSIVDRIFVGRGIGSLALSGVAVTFPISNVIMAFGMLIGIGAATIVSIKLGQQRVKHAEKIVGNAFSLVIILSILVTIFGIIFLDPILKLLGASSETMPYAKQFATIILLGVVLQNIGFGMNPLIRSEGDPKTAMITMLIGAVLNFILNPILIFGFKLGVTGSALATVISQAVCSLWIFSYFTKGKSLLKLHVSSMKLDKAIIKEIVAIGMSPFAMQIAASLVTVVFNKSLAQYGGDIAIGAFALINSIVMLILMPLFGINQGAQPIIGYNYGAENINRVKKTLVYASAAAASIATIGVIIVELFPVQIIRIFNTSDAQLIDIGSKGITIFVSMFSIAAVQIVIANYFQAIGKAKHSMFLSLLRQVLLLIPMLLILPRFFGLTGVWMAAAVSDFISSVISIILLVFEFKKLNKNKKDDNEEFPSALEAVI